MGVTVPPSSASRLMQNRLSLLTPARFFSVQAAHAHAQAVGDGERQVVAGHGTGDPVEHRAALHQADEAGPGHEGRCAGLNRRAHQGDAAVPRLGRQEGRRLF